jgi:hypothetical protein
MFSFLWRIQLENSPLNSICYCKSDEERFMIRKKCHMLLCWPHYFCWLCEWVIVISTAEVNVPFTVYQCSHAYLSYLIGHINVQNIQIWSEENHHAIIYCTMLGHWWMPLDLLHCLFTTLLVVITISPYNEFWLPDVLSGGSPLMSSVFRRLAANWLADCY